MYVSPVSKCTYAPICVRSNRIIVNKFPAAMSVNRLLEYETWKPDLLQKLGQRMDKKVNFICHPGSASKVYLKVQSSKMEN